jgi:hypothetical protein
MFLILVVCDSGPRRRTSGPVSVSINNPGIGLCSKKVRTIARNRETFMAWPSVMIFEIEWRRQ